MFDKMGNNDVLSGVVIDQPIKENSEKVKELKDMVKGMLKMANLEKIVYHIEKAANQVGLAIDKNSPMIASAHEQFDKNLEAIISNTSFEKKVLIELKRYLKSHKDSLRNDDLLFPTHILQDVVEMGRARASNLDISRDFFQHQCHGECQEGDYTLVKQRMNELRFKIEGSMQKLKKM